MQQACPLGELRDNLMCAIRDFTTDEIRRFCERKDGRYGVHFVDVLTYQKMEELGIPFVICDLRVEHNQKDQDDDNFSRHKLAYIHLLLKNQYPPY